MEAQADFLACLGPSLHTQSGAREFVAQRPGHLARQPARDPRRDEVAPLRIELWGEQVEDEVRRAGLNERPSGIAQGTEVVWIGGYLHRTLDGCRIAPDCGAVFVEDGAQAAELVGRTATVVPDVSVLRHHAQRQLLAAAADDERRVRPLDGLGVAAGTLKLV